MLLRFAEKFILGPFLEKNFFRFSSESSVLVLNCYNRGVNKTIREIPV